ncbi:MAG: glucose-6-phosphate dehydrogenase [Gammaproteobacteria bacterium]|nr:glucose-6-phosphate dehydrogenase [Gammaproteobacteria bacterium]
MSETTPAFNAQPAPPCVMVIFGAGGDLTKRKLLPSLYNLSASGLLTERFGVVAVDRLEINSEAFRDRMSQDIRNHVGGDFRQDIWEDLVRRLYYVQGDFKDPASYEHLGRMLEEIDGDIDTTGSYLFYLATPPSFFGEITRQLGAAGLVTETDSQWRRVIIEKPFGHDLDSAKALNRALHDSLEETQIYRIDHYLGKETVQNILVFRFANGITEPIWNHLHIDHVQITVAESVGVEHRASYYEEAGALRDMIPNHLLVLLSVIAMEPPNSFQANAVRIEGNKVLKAITPLSPEDVLTHAVRGQYAAGSMPDGEQVQAYRSSPGVAPDSHTETFAAAKLMIDNWRWAGVPFYLRTGKRLAAHYTEIAIQYRRAPFIMFRNTPVEHVRPNTMVLRIQPSEGIELSFGAKLPGPSMNLGNVEMDFCYADYFGNPPTTGYETLIYDCMNGDATLFKHAETVEAGWEFVQPILDVWHALPPRDFPNYAAGSWGPKPAGELLRRDGRQWRRITPSRRDRAT